MTCLVSLLLSLALANPAPTPPASSPAPTATQPPVPPAAGPALLSQAAAAPTITAPAKLSVKVGRFAQVTVTTTGKSLVLVSSSAEVDAFREFTDPSVYVFRVIAYTAGTYRVTWVSTLNDVPTQFVTEVTTDGKPPPPPIDPDPPPDPKPDPAPIPLPGFRALIVYETAELGKLPAAQLAALYSREVRDYLNAKTARGPDGKTGEWRLWDKDVDATAEAAHWQAALKRPRKGVPWLIISDGKTGFEGYLPTNAAELLSLLKKWGG